jgi:hypothetical protein
MDEQQQPEPGDARTVALREKKQSVGGVWIALEALWKPQPPGSDPQPPPEQDDKARPTGRDPQTTRSGPPSRANGKEGVIGSSPMLGLL